MILNGRLTRHFLFLIISILFTSHSFAQSNPKEINETFHSKNNSSLNVSVKWTTDPNSQEDVLRSILSYHGNFKEKTYRWVQIARVQLEDDSDYIFQGFQEDRNSVRTKDGFYLDQNYDICRINIDKCSFIYRDHFENPNESAEIDNLSQMADFPFGWRYFKRITLESCLYNTKTKKIMDCVHWGAEWSIQGEQKIFEPKYHATPSPAFIDALNRFKMFYNLKSR
jgi:hypothetical protein